MKRPPGWLVGLVALAIATAFAWYLRDGERDRASLAVCHASVDARADLRGVLTGAVDRTPEPHAGNQVVAVLDSLLEGLPRTHCEYRDGAYIATPLNGR